MLFDVRYISIHAPREGRDRVLQGFIIDTAISIHAPREGRDRGKTKKRESKNNFNPRAPRGARRPKAEKIKGAKRYFNPRAPRGARQVSQGIAVMGKLFQSTRPARGATRGARSTGRCKQKFQSTRPARGATHSNRDFKTMPRISIHAPREGRDAEHGIEADDSMKFQSTRPARGATRRCRRKEVKNNISIHAPREGRDSKSEQISSHIFAKKAWIPDIFAQNAAFQSVLPLADRQKLLYLRCEPLRKFLRACASHYKIIGSSGRYVCLQPKCSILFSYFLPK
mgnify:CR=1 FL=1